MRMLSCIVLLLITSFTAAQSSVRVGAKLEKIAGRLLSVELYTNYPDPFNPFILISWQLATYSLVALTIYNCLGKEIAVLVKRKNHRDITKLSLIKKNIGLIAAYIFMN
jgi:hypothetical protein